jgi:Icc-related predicted phosphoesterase
MKLKVTLISDTHAKHNRLNGDLPGGDLLIHAGDFMTSGYSLQEARDFFNWYDKIAIYDTKVFIAGNHDRIMQNEPEQMKGELTGYKTIDYLEDDWIGMYYDGMNGDNPEDNVRIYGSPWQPEFFQWAYNLPRNGDELKAKWDAIPENIDILVTHGPAWGFLDDTEGRRGTHLGCELLAERIKMIRPKIHVCGHIHSGNGHYFDGHTHFFNAAVLNEQYMYANTPWNFEWDTITNEITWK